MPKFSQESFSKLSTCHLDLQAIFFEVVKNFDCTIIEGHRGEEEQHQAFISNKSKLDWPHGKHNAQPSNAVDVAPYPLNWMNINEFYYFAGYVMGVAQKLKDDGKVTHGLRYGGDWNCDKIIGGQQFNDLVHFELIV